MLILPLMLVGMWLWKTYSEGSPQPPVAYSQLYQWIEQGKVESVVLDGEVVSASLKTPETLDGRQIKDLQTNVAPNDSQLLPLLRQCVGSGSRCSYWQPWSSRSHFWASASAASPDSVFVSGSSGSSA